MKRYFSFVYMPRRGMLFMKRFLSGGVLMVVRAFALSLVLAVAAAAAPTSTVTFHKDVEPILQRNCQTCHRPGETAPMSFLSYQDVRPWAKSIREAVSVRKMPPWPADPHYGKRSEERRVGK